MAKLEELKQKRNAAREVKKDENSEIEAKMQLEKLEHVYNSFLIYSL
jgi:hypothetical protein